MRWKIKPTTWYGISFWVALLGAGFFAIGWYGHNAVLFQTVSTSSAGSIQVRENSEEYQYINPILYVDNSQTVFHQLNSLKETLTDTVDGAVSNGEASKVAVYFRDLNKGMWTGINEDVPFTPGSMLKVMTMLAYLQLADDDSSILLKKIPYKYEEDRGQYYKPPQIYPPGDYSIRSLLTMMIVNSDNSAMNRLDAERAPDILHIYDELKLPNPIENSNPDFFTARQYSRILRVLYNSTYLSRTYSEDALKLMTYAKFDRGLVAGVPPGTAVAHKFGEHTVLENGNVKEHQLHDCGIVYIPEKPYILCVMTKGMDFPSLEKVISDISREVYVYVDKNL